MHNQLSTKSFNVDQSLFNSRPSSYFRLGLLLCFQVKSLLLGIDFKYVINYFVNVTLRFYYFLIKNLLVFHNFICMTGTVCIWCILYSIQDLGKLLQQILKTQHDYHFICNYLATSKINQQNWTFLKMLTALCIPNWSEKNKFMQI